MAEGVRIRLGDALIDRGLLEQEQLGVALNEQKRNHRPLGEILVSLGMVRADAIAEILAESLNLPFVRARDLEPDLLLVSSVQPEFVRSSGAFPISIKAGTLHVAMTDPGNPEMVAHVRKRFPYALELNVITDGDLQVLVRKHLAAAHGQVARLLKSSDNEGEQLALPIEQLTLAIMVDGVHRSATDIHIEPEEKVTRVRYRIDGVLLQGENLPRDGTDAIISRLKIMSGLDIAERRRPQDGRVRIHVDGRNIDMRVSIMPCAFGENVVLRVLDRSAGNLRLSLLGIVPRIFNVLHRIADRQHGLFLVTGPTGSGKTTTLYGMLSEVDAIHRNVTTVEDPVEYSLPLIRQSQVEPSAGYNFNDGLRALLRQDPDVILVGEIRDFETADMAVKAAMTGHLVLSTLHTNTAIGAIPRLIDLGIAPYLVDDALIGVLAQRLVRKVCDSCGVPVDEPTEEEVRWLDGDTGEMHRGPGCEDCGKTGLNGRTVINELFLPNEEIGEVVRSGADLTELRRLAGEMGFIDMTDDGKEKVRRGLTTKDEVDRVNRSHRLSEEEREGV